MGTAYLSGDRSGPAQRTFHFLAAAIVPLFARGIGVVFLLSGIGKSLALTPFRETIRTLTGIPEPLCSVVALIVVALELFCGAGLVLQKRVRIASTLLALLVSLFLLVLVSAVYQNTVLACNCFGILGGTLSMPTRIILDFLLLNTLAVVVFFYRSRDRVLPPMHPHQMLSFILSAVMLLYLETEIVLAAWSRSTDTGGRELYTLVRHVQKASPLYGSGGGNRALLLLRLEDFNCPPCYDDFLLLSDSLCSSLSTCSLQRVAGIISAAGSTPDHLQARLRQWKRAAGIAFPLLAVPDSLFSQAGIVRSTVAVLDSPGRTLFYGTLPIGPAARGKVVSLLSGDPSLPSGSP
jgi:uncharacterized membrane protein YphA (DoxX/SURF4 family)